ncbi:TPA: hypothetical protein ND538_004304 [Serratia marcescens]|nr:hypothetical protein [Serratia marcescens]
MKRSEIRKALEAWFDVERYEAIEKLTLQQFYVEVERLQDVVESEHHTDL